MQAQPQDEDRTEQKSFRIRRFDLELRGGQAVEDCREAVADIPRRPEICLTARGEMKADTVDHCAVSRPHSAQRSRARVAELVDAGDSKSPAERHAGSSPASGTNHG